jgi:hypothetical protein
MTYKNLEQRTAQTFIDMFPQFIPDEHAPVSMSEQKEFYVLMKNLYQSAFDEPLLFAASLHEDDAYPNRFNKSSYGKPDLQKNMKKFIKEVDSLLQNMYLAARSSGVEFNKKQQNILSKLGITDLAKLPKAWIWMSNRPESNPVTFSHCLFKKDYPYTSDLYARLLGEQPFRKLENWMLEKGYKRFDIYNITASDCKLSLTYANPLWGGDPPRGGFEYKIRHTGVSAQYEPLLQHPPVFGLCIPNGLKTYLNVFDSMDKQIQGFIVSRTKKCNGCRYCVQTDKTKSRPLAYIKVKYEQKEYNLCPYFPGYSFCWTNIDHDLADRLIEILAFMDKFAPDSTGK